MQINAFLLQAKSMFMQCESDQAREILKNAREVALQTLNTNDEDAYFTFLTDYSNLLLQHGTLKDFELDLLKSIVHQNEV